MTAIASWLLALAILAFAVHSARRVVQGLMTGSARSDDAHWPSQVKRDQRPVLFWFYVTGWALGAVSGAVIGMMLLFAPDRWLEIVS